MFYIVGLLDQAEGNVFTITKSHALPLFYYYSISPDLKEITPNISVNFAPAMPK